MNFIDIKESETGDRQSSLIVNHNHLTVLGELPHQYKFTPASIHDAQKLIAWCFDFIQNNTDDTYQATIGQKWAQFLGLKKKRATGRYDFESGNKTDIGLYRTIARLVSGEFDI